jgi:hypothetical protein
MSVSNPNNQCPLPDARAVSSATALREMHDRLFMQTARAGTGSSRYCGTRLLRPSPTISSSRVKPFSRATSALGFVSGNCIAYRSVRFERRKPSAGPGATSLTETA